MTSAADGRVAAGSPSKASCGSTSGSVARASSVSIAGADMTSIPSATTGIGAVSGAVGITGRGAGIT